MIIWGLLCSKGDWHAFLGRSSRERICLVRSKFGPLEGGTCGNLGYEFECWVEFNFWFDHTHESCRCQWMKVWGRGLKEMSLMHSIFELYISLWLDQKMKDHNFKWKNFRHLGGSELHLTCIKVEVNFRLWNESKYRSSVIHGLPCVDTLNV
jgi:hypothetical protein